MRATSGVLITLGSVRGVLFPAFRILLSTAVARGPEGSGRVALTGPLRFT